MISPLLQNRLSELTCIWFPVILALSFGCSNTSEPLVDEYYIYCNADSLRHIYENFSEDIFISAKVKTKGGISTAARLRLRGDTSRSLKKKSLKIRFEQPRANGSDVLNLNAEFLDKSYMRQYLSARVMQQCGQACFNTRHAVVYLNDVFYGVYLEVENMDDQFLERNGLDASSNFYKAAKDGACLNPRDNTTAVWEKKTNKNLSWYDLAALTEEIERLDSTNCKEFLEEKFVYSEIINLVALNFYLCNGSTYYHNYYLYHDLWSDGKWKMLPWDLDKTLSYYDWKMPYEISGEWTGDNLLAEKIFRCKDVMHDVKQRIAEIDVIVKDLDVVSEIDRLESALEKYVAMDVTDDVNDIAEWKSKVNDQKQFFENTLRNRHESFRNSLSLFDVVGLERTASHQPTLNWQRCTNPDGSKVEYSIQWVRFEDRWREDSVRTWTTPDTSFMLPERIEPGKYLWRVEAVSGEKRLTGFNSANFTEVVDATSFVKSGRKTVLMKSHSPYLIDATTIFPANEELMIEPGVEIFLARDIELILEGKIECTGTSENKIVFRASEPISGKEAIVVHNHTGNRFSNSLFMDVRFNYHSCDVELDRCFFEMRSTDLGRMGRASIIWGEGGNFTMTNSEISGNRTGEGINIHRGTAFIQGNRIERCPDSIELISMHDSRISANYVARSPDDAVDLNNCKRIKIENNTLEHNGDKGISIGVDHTGKSMAVSISGNTIANNKVGIEIKDSSAAIVSKNVLVDNRRTIVLARRDTNYLKGGHAWLIGNKMSSRFDEKQIHCDSLSGFMNCTWAELKSQLFVEGLNEFQMKLPEVNHPDTLAHEIEISVKTWGLVLRTHRIAPLQLGGWKLRLHDVAAEEIILPAGMELTRSSDVAIVHTRTKEISPTAQFIFWLGLKNFATAHIELRNETGELMQTFGVDLNNPVQ